MKKILMRTVPRFPLVEKEVQLLINDSTLEELQKLRDQIEYHLSIKDESMDSDFMRTVLENMASSSTRCVSSSAESDRGTGQFSLSDFSVVEKRMLEEEIRKGLEEDEEVFVSSGKDFNRPERLKYYTTGQSPPRYPKFYNKVKAGVIWNKYAQTHYDEDNPPPKQVFGYKFNIFYPDLVDPSKAPQYKIETCEASQEYILLRFTASAPYEDVVFRILNKEWDLDRRSGFTCQFARGVLQLYFKFKQDRYRR